MNVYFERMIEIITQYHGTVREFQGDGLLIFFGAPLSNDDDPFRAIACAIAMQKAVNDLNAEQNLTRLPKLTMGIGINTGKVVVGNIGCKKRATYGAIGAAINLAYRIESLTFGGQVLISSDTYEKVKDLVDVRGSKEILLKGIDHRITVYDVVGIRGEHEISLPEKEEDHLLPLDPPLPITCFVVEGKTLGSTPISGHMTSLGDHSAIVSFSQQLEELSDVKITVSCEQGCESLEVYAKVSKIMPFDPTSSTCNARLEFTSIAENFKETLLRRIAAAANPSTVRP
jgi:adenylate cyclase